MARARSREPADYSPTTSSFLSSTSNHTSSGSVRRNLFSTHLSRRPASRNQPPPQMDGQGREQGYERQVGAQQNQWQQNASSHLTRSRGDQHPTSTPTPSPPPSPPRMSPFHDTRNNAFSPTPIPQLSPPRRPALADGYDPTISPNRPLSPRSSAALFPNQSVIALNPLTGRPVLPKLPVLPGRLKLTDSSDEEGDEEPEEGGEEDDEDEGLGVHNPSHAQEHVFSGDDFRDPAVHAYTRRTNHDAARHQPHHQDHNPYDPYVQAQQQSPAAKSRADHHAAVIAAAQAQAQADVAQAAGDDEATSMRLDRERIERLLREMMSRQRARAAATSVKGKSAASSTVAGVDEEDDEEAAEEKEELMGLIMGSLRRELGRAEEEAWMFGEPVGVGATVGRDEVGI